MCDLGRAIRFLWRESLGAPQLSAVNERTPGPQAGGLRHTSVSAPALHKASAIENYQDPPPFSQLPLTGELPLESHEACLFSEVQAIIWGSSEPSPLLSGNHVSLEPCSSLGYFCFELNQDGPEQKALFSRATDWFIRISAFNKYVWNACAELTIQGDKTGDLVALEELLFT